MKEEKETIEAEDKENYAGRSTVRKGGRVTLPNKVMDYLKVKPGDKLCLKLEGLDTKVLVLTKA